MKSIRQLRRLREIACFSMHQAFHEVYKVDDALMNLAFRAKRQPLHVIGQMGWGQNASKALHRFNGQARPTASFWQRKPTAVSSNFGPTQ